MVYTGSMGAGPLHTQVCSIKNSACATQHVQVVWIQQVRDSHPTTPTAVTEWAHFLQNKKQKHDHSSQEFARQYTKYGQQKFSGCMQCNNEKKNYHLQGVATCEASKYTFYQASLKFPK